MTDQNNTGTNANPNPSNATPPAPQPSGEDYKKTIETLQNEIKELKSKNSNQNPSNSTNPSFYDMAKSQIEKEQEQQNRDEEIASLKEFELTFDKYVEENKIFISPTALKTVELIKNSNLSEGEKMKQTKSMLITDTFNVAENFNALIEEDQKEIQKFLSFKDDVKNKQANHYFTIMKRFLSSKKQTYTKEMTQKANIGMAQMNDPKYSQVSDLAKRSADKFLNIKDYDFKVVKV